MTRASSFEGIPGIKSTDIGFDPDSNQCNNTPTGPFVHIRSTGVPNEGGSIVSSFVPVVTRHTFTMFGEDVLIEVPSSATVREVLVVPPSLRNELSQPQDRPRGYDAELCWDELDDIIDLAPGGSQLLVGPLHHDYPDSVDMSADQPPSEECPLFHVGRLATPDQAHLTIAGIAAVMGLDPAQAQLVAQRALNFDNHPV